MFLLAGVINLLGQPLGVGQGNNPTCQSAIGLSMWASNEADYLLQVLTWAARDNEVLSRFEGQEVSSRNLEPGLVKGTPVDVDPVSLVLIPHLDRIYGEMWRRCENRDDDAHRWINPEFYGWWVSHGFRVVADVQTGEIQDYEDFIRHFYASYHPFYNGNMPVIHAQPAGIAVTDSAARFVGRHAINILRVALSPKNEMRVYFSTRITTAARIGARVLPAQPTAMAKFAAKPPACGGIHFQTVRLPLRHAGAGRSLGDTR